MSDCNHFAIQDPELFDTAMLDVYGRFITLLPDDILKDHVHLCFYLQEAYWWYCDKWQIRHDSLPSLKFNQFLNYAIENNPLLRVFVTPKQQASMLSQWKNYMKNIPLRGAILLNAACDSVLLVQSYSSGTWTFPRGKRNHGEDDHVCAIREVLEETGIDITEKIHSNIYTEVTASGKSIKLFYSPGWNRLTMGEPRTNFEIRKVQWIPLSDLRHCHGHFKYKTFDVLPFLDEIFTFCKGFKRGAFVKEFPGALLLYKTLARPESKAQVAYQDRKSIETFGPSLERLSPDEMFRINKQLFGIDSEFVNDDQGHSRQHHHSN
ncbi:bifunctional mRNA decapping protein 2 [Babesia duncani]|uniref:Bifunctional mRNA decapping protein 2 n=1 Tax=Babesia duncani TaxID=323732 RepID=A0AAD9UPH2_9APIC|nr:bifunctional mRNA decapping protein 2 [Babesia duncani]